MARDRAIKVVTATWVALAPNAALAGSDAFVGRWHWNPAQSTLPPGEPAPNDLTAEFSEADGDRLV